MKSKTVYSVKPKSLGHSIHSRSTYLYFATAQLILLFYCNHWVKIMIWVLQSFQRRFFTSTKRNGISKKKVFRAEVGIVLRATVTIVNSQYLTKPKTRWRIFWHPFRYDLDFSFNIHSPLHWMLWSNILLREFLVATLVQNFSRWYCGGSLPWPGLEYNNHT